MVSGVAVALPSLGAELHAGAVVLVLVIPIQLLLAASWRRPARYIATMHLAFWVLAAVTAVALAISARVRWVLRISSKAPGPMPAV